jgi:hypothetical protein
MPIELPPSDNTESLSRAIEQATTTGEPLRLLPGTHLTKPGVGIRTPIGPKGLTLTGPGSITTLAGNVGNVARIQRPDHSIGTGPQKRTDDNYGIFFVPAPPTPEEVARIQWLTYRDKTGNTVQYGIIIRGDIRIDGITVDCNMGNQGLESLTKAQVEHSGMLGFSGLPYPQKDGRQVYVGFNSITLSDIILARGGFADDIFIFPGYFRPNIQRVEFSGIVSEARVNPRRASIGFSGLTQEVSIHDCRLDTLHLELDEDWSTFPGPATSDPRHFHDSAWALNKIGARGMSFAAKGAVQTITAANLDVSESFQVHFAAGSISDSRLALSDQDRRLFSLRNLQFRNCVWTIGQSAGGAVRGLALSTDSSPDHERPFAATFHANTFATAGGFQSGQLIDTGDHSPDTGNRITATFHQCKYQQGFATSQFPNTHIARLRQEGDYTFFKADFNGLNPAQAVDAINAQKTEQGEAIVYHIA